MAAQRSVIAPEKLAEARYLYEQTSTPAADIAPMLGVCRDTLRKRAKGWGWVRHAHDSGAARRDKTSATLPAAAVQQQPAPPDVTEERLALIRRLYRLANEQMDGLESALPARTPDEADLNTRVMAGLLRTMRELALLEAQQAPLQAGPKDDDELPHDVDEIRRELSRKLAALVAGREGAVPSGD